MQTPQYVSPTESNSPESNQPTHPQTPGPLFPVSDSPVAVGGELIPPEHISSDNWDWKFPLQAMQGSSLGELAVALAGETEVPEEFLFGACMTCFGALCAGKLSISAGIESDPRLYTVLLGQSYSVKKSTAMQKAINFFEPWFRQPGPTVLGPVEVLHGIGSAEGLARSLEQHKIILVAYDEFRAFFDKSKVESSVLLPMVASLFEGNSWDNPTKRGPISVRDAHLVLIGCCTQETYERMWNSQAVAIGLPNRLFVVWADRKGKVAWPKAPDAALLRAIKDRITRQLARLPQTFEITPHARSQWECWYKELPEKSVHTKRLDTLGFRIMEILALSLDKDVVDWDVIERTTAILNYEHKIRMNTDPIDADTLFAQMEEKIRRALRRKPGADDRILKQCTNAHRTGLWVYQTAMHNLQYAGEVKQDRGGYWLVD